MERIKPITNLLSEDDYVRGFGMDTSLYMRIEEARRKYNELHPENKIPIREDFKDEYDLLEGIRIDGKPYNTRPHPMLNKTVTDSESGDDYLVEGVYRHHYYGYYWVLLIRRLGTKSHGLRYWKNETCKHPTIIEGIEEDNKQMIFKD